MAKKNKQRESFVSDDVVLLCCRPGDAGSEPISIVTVAGRKTGTITNLMLTLPECRKLVVRLLASLESSEDEFAASLLESRFSTDSEGHHRWPEEDEGFGV